MADETKLREQSARGDEAARILSSPILKDIFTRMKTEIRGAWEETDAQATDEREHQWRMYQTITQFEDCFRQIIATGDHAMKQLTKPKEEGNKNV